MINFRDLRAFVFFAAVLGVLVSGLVVFGSTDVNEVEWHGVKFTKVDRVFGKPVLIYNIDGPISSEQTGYVIEYANQTGAGELVINISSPGGKVFDAIEIANRIHKSSVPVVTVTRSIAGSAAFYVFISGHKRVMAKNAFLMHHSIAVPYGVTLTDAQKKFIERLQQRLNDYVKTIACGDEDEEAALFDIKFGSSEETWIDAKRAKKLCLIDEEE